MLSLNIPSTSDEFTTSTSNTTSTTARTISSTQKFEPTKRKGSVCENGKYFSSSFPGRCCQGTKKMKDSESWDFTNFFSYDSVDSCLRERYHYNVTSPSDKVFVLCSKILQGKLEKPQPTRGNREYVGYIVKISGYYKSLTPDEELLFFKKVLVDSFATSLG